MKANQKFVTSDEAVSPVIGVILMVAITVVLAAVVFVLVSDLGDTGDAAEQASVTVQSNNADQITILLVTEGDKAPYASGDVRVSTDGDVCVNLADTAPPFSTGTPAGFNAGESLNYAFVDSGATAGQCNKAIASGATVDVQVVVTIEGTVVFNGAVAVSGV